MSDNTYMVPRGPTIKLSTKTLKIKLGNGKKHIIT